MAYNLQSLVHILERNLLHPDPQQYVLFHETHMLLTSLLEKVDSLKRNLDKYPLAAIRKINNLESQITDAVCKAEDIIESHMVDQILLKPRGEKLIISPVDLQHVFDELDSAIEKVLKIEDQMMIGSSFTSASASFAPNQNEEIFAVGLDDDIVQLKERLTGPQANLEVIPIAGMGGIGKTTLARHLYNDSLVTYHFDLCAWATVSQEYNVLAILASLISCITDGDIKELVPEMDINELVPKPESIELLGEVLYKSLSGKRYFIVLDDIWTNNVWNDIRMFFPNNKGGSRIIITTRNVDVADYAKSFGSYHKMQLLNASMSWDLLCKKVFGNENCPSPLELIGRGIAQDCRGLPLAIHVIGGLLSKAPKIVSFWSDVGNDVSSAVAGEEDQGFSKILSLSYEHLPHHLRPCFLYLGGFQEDYEIEASRLIRLWVAEGFLQPIAERTLEEAAKMYLKALVDRNLLLVAKRKFNGEVKSYVIHDMLRDLCMQKATEEKFVYVVINKMFDVILMQDSPQRMRHMNIHSTVRYGWCNSFEVMSMPLVRSFVCAAYGSERNKSMFLAFRLLRVLDITDFQLWWFPEEILQLVNIRHLALCLFLDLPSSICKLRNLQSLIIQGFYWTRVPFGIFGLPQMRHILLKGVPFAIKGHREDFVSENLQTVSGVVASVFSDNKFTKGIPNLRKLGIKCSDFEVVDLSSLHKLETLKCSGYKSLQTAIFLSCLTLSPSIKKLTLESCPVTRGFMTRVGSLPDLEVLKLKNCDLLDDDMKQVDAWVPTEGEFMSLEFLLLEGLELVHWRANETHFPRLRHLAIRSCHELKKIPRDIGDIHTLEIIELHNSSLAGASARLIQKEQCDVGNFGLQVRIHNPESTNMTDMSLERSFSNQSTESAGSLRTSLSQHSGSDRNSGESSIYHGSAETERNSAKSLSQQSAHEREGRARNCPMSCFRCSKVDD